MTTRRAVSRDLVERVLDLPLGVAVERAGGLVEQQDRRRLEDRARDGDALLLAARELQAALAHHGAVALRQPRMKASICAMRAASRTSSSLASGRP